MTRLFGAMLALVFLAAADGQARADDQAVTAILDKAIKALGGEEKLAKAEAVSWKTKGTLSFDGNETAVTTGATVKGLDQYRGEFEGNFGGNDFKAVTVINGDKGWSKFGDMNIELDADRITNEKRSAVYLQVVPITVVPLKGKGFKVETGGEEQVDGKPAAVLKITGPDGRGFTLSFDKESGLPVKQVADVVDFMGVEYNQETTYGDYKDFGGIKKATKLELKRDGTSFFKQEVTEFKALDKVDADTFTEPK